MKADYLNPFLKGISSIVEEVAGERPALGRPFLRPGYPYNVDGVAIFIGVTGHLTGQVVICIQDECARGIAAAMLMEGEIKKLDEYAQSALAELVNMIVASATIGLSEVGYRTDITPPSVVTGEKVEISNQSKIPTLAIPLTVLGGKIEVNLSLVEAASIGK